MLSNINEQINRLSETMETTLLHKIEHYGRQVEQLLQVGIPQHNNKVQQIVGIPVDYLSENKYSGAYIELGS